MKKALPDFSGKTVSLAIIGAESARIIVDPHFTSQGGRLFLIGKIPQGASLDDWMEGLEGAVAWDRVEEYVIFESFEDYIKRLKTWKKGKGRK